MASQGAEGETGISANDLDRRTLIVGLGSPILRDDAIGLHVARALAGRLPPERFDVVEAGVSGLRLLLTLDGYERAVIIDALREPPDPSDEPCLGKLHRLPLDKLQSTLRLNTSHEASLADTLTLGRLTGMSLPEDITIFGIEVADPFTFGEDMTPPLDSLVDPLADSIAEVCCRA